MRTESLLSFDTQQQFVQVLKEFFDSNLTSGIEVDHSAKSKNVLIIQCECGHFYQDLITCARFTIIDEYSKYITPASGENSKSLSLQPFHIILIIQIPKIAGGCLSGFQTSKWYCYHIDDIQDNLFVGNIFNYKDKSLGELFHEANSDSNFAQMFVSMLKSVIYVACSKVTDEKVNDRSIQRIEILLNLLKYKPEFTRIVLKHISLLQWERENILQGQLISKNWLFNEVSRISSVIKYGTLRNSCQSYIETRLCHLFSGLIAILDTNRNLDLLGGNDSWITRFWLRVFDDGELINLNYRNYLLANNVEKTEFVCSTYLTRHNNDQNQQQPLKLKLPFSFTIKQILDRLVNLKIKEKKGATMTDEALESDLELFEQLKSAFEQSILMEKFSDFIATNEFVNFYLNDYILLSLNQLCISENHLKIMIRRILDYSRSHFKVANLISVTFAFSLLKSELNLFSKFAQSSSRVVELQIKSETKNQNLCYSAARIISTEFDKVEPTMKKVEWLDWLEKVKYSSHLIENFLHLNESHSENEFRSYWQKVSIMKYFIEHLCKPNDSLYLRCFYIWKKLEGEFDIKKMDSFNKIINFVDITNRCIAEKLKTDAIKCNGCSQAEYEYLNLVEGCRGDCRICELCVDESKTTDKCAGCSEKLKSNVKFTRLDISNSSNQKLKQFKLNLNGFFMDIVLNLCFDRTASSYQTLPDAEVISKIILHLLPRQVESDKEKEAVLSFDLNLSPSIKSTLFQLLLNYTETTVEAHLDEIFSKSAHYLRTKYNTQDLVNLKLMYVNSIEDSLHSKYDSSRSDELVKKVLEFLSNVNYDLTVEFDDDGRSKIVARLKTIAKIRFSLVTFANLIVNGIDGGLSADILHLNDMVKDLIETNDRCLWLRFFLIKNIFRIHGQSGFKKLASSNLYKWIIPSNIVNSNEVNYWNYAK